MNVFEAVKQSVTTRQAAEHYGIRVGRNGMACCPFHNDKTPSMKLDRRYHLSLIHISLTVLFMGFPNIPDNEVEVIQNHVAEIFIIADMGGLQHFQMGICELTDRF